VPAVGAGADGSCFLPIEVEESAVVDSQIVSSWTDDSEWLR